MTFGVSIGDVIAVSKLAHSVMVALSDARGAEASYKTAIELLRSLSSTIETVSLFISSSHESTQMQISDALKNGLRLHISACYSLMTQFLNDSKKYTESLFNGKGSGVLKEFRKVRWSLYHSDDVGKLERHLLMHFTSLQQYLALINIQYQSQASSRTQVSIRAIENALKVGSKFVQEHQQSRQRSLGVPWHDGGGAGPIVLEDFFARTHPMPQLLCRDFRTFYDALGLMFRGTMASRVLDNQQFEIIDLSNLKRIWPSEHLGTLQMDNFSPLECLDWHTSVVPGTKLALNWVKKVEKQIPDNELMPAFPKTRNCPRCKVISRGIGYLTCEACDVTFGHSLEERSKGRKPDWDAWPTMTFNLMKLESPFERVSEIVGTSKSSSQPCSESRAESEELPASIINTGEEEQGEEEELQFRRIHVIEEYIRPQSHAFNEFHLSRVPIIQAAGHGDTRWVRQLLAATAMAVNVRDHQGWTPLQQACAQGKGACEDVVRLLLESGAEVNARPGKGFARTALQAACECPFPSVPVVNILLDYGANIQAPSLPGEPTALQAAAMQGNLLILRLLIQRGALQNNPPSESAFSATAALQAAAAGPRERTPRNIQRYIDCINLLIEHGADVNAPPAARARYTALQRAAWQNQVEIALRLLELGADPNGDQHPFTGKTAIQAGAKCGPMIDLLMGYGADINAPPSSAGRTTLQHAAAIPGGNLPLMRKLIQYGADVNQDPAPFWGRTAVQEASHYGSLEVVIALVDEYNADVNGPTALGSGPLTALEACAFRGSVSNNGHSCLPVMEFLLNRGAKLTPNVLHFAAAKGEGDTVELLLKHGARIYDPPTPFEPEPIPRGNDRPLGKDVFDTARINRQDSVLPLLRRWLHHPEQPARKDM